ncbi:MAG: hypothetical protein QNJ14_00970 [Woeseiaceae bacterium]|nr:hypothetical protein [Woeseiaceae bacterium]
MPTKRKSRRVRVASSDVATGTGVFAPSQVRTQSDDARKAAVLSDALGLGRNKLGEAIARRQDKAFLRGTKAFFEGREPTPEELESDAFVFGFKRSEHDRKLIEFKTELAESYPEDRLAEGFDVNAWLDAKAQEAFPLDPEVDLDRAFIPETTQYLNGLRTQYLAAEVRNTRAETLDQMADNLAVKAGDIVGETGMVSAEQWKEIDREAFEVGGVDYAKRTMFGIAKQMAAAGNVEALSTIPERGQGTWRSDPDFAGQYERLAVQAQNVRDAQNERNTTAYVGVRRAALSQLAEAGDLGAVEAIVSAAAPDENGVTVLDTPEQVASLINKYYDANQKRALDLTALTAWREGNARVLTDNEKDAASMLDAQAVVANAIAQGREPEEAEALGRAYLVERSTVNNHLPGALKDEIDVSPKNSEAWQNAVALYDQLESQQEGFVGRYLRSDLVRDIVTYKRMLREYGGNAEQALEALNAIDRELPKQVPTKDRREAEESVRDKLADGPLLSTLVEDSLPLRKMIADEMDYYLSRGYSLEQAEKNALDSLHPKSGRYMVVEGHLYKNGGGWDHNAAKVAEWTREQYAEENDLNSGDVEIVPIPAKPGRVRIISDDMMLPGSVTEVAISDLNAEWQRGQVEAEREAIEKGRQAARDEAIQKAKEANYPLPSPSSFRDPAMLDLMLLERERRWNALTDAQRERLISRSST